MTILIVDDEQDIATHFVATLNDDGIQAKGVTSGYEAMRIIETENIRCVVTDYFMEGGDGISLAHFCANRGIPCIIVTGMPMAAVEPYIPAGIPVIEKTKAAHQSKLTEIVSQHLELQNSSGKKMKSGSDSKPCSD